MQEEQQLGRVPPHSEKAEQALLASVLMSDRALNDVIEFVSPEDFYRLRNQAIFQAILELGDRGERPDLVTLSEHLKSSGKLDEVGGMEYLSELFAHTPTAANAVRYAHIIRERAVLRQVGEVGSEMVRQSFETDAGIDDILDMAEKEIFQLSQRKGDKPYYPIRQLVTDSFQLIESLYEKQELVTGVPSGFRDLDQMLAGFQPSDLVILAARPSMGKTAMVLNITTGAAVRNKTPVLFFSLEMSRIQLVMRMLCSEARVDGNKLRRGFLSEKDWPNLTTAAGLLSEAPIFIDDTPGLNIREMRTKARRLALEHGLGLIIIDYLQLMEGPGGSAKSENRTQEISQISRGLKALGRELKVPVISLSQLSRAVESRTDKRPMLSDLRESGAIEQDADVVMFLYRDEYYNKEKSEDQGVAEVIIAKQRNGPVGTVKLKYFEQYTRFADLSFARE